MMTSTPGFGAAVGSAETVPATAVTFTWPASITGVPTIPVAAIEQITPQASWTTDMPEGTKLITGYPARQATMVLSGIVGTDETMTAQWLFDPWSTTSPLYGLDWTGTTGALIVVQQGLILPGAAAAELFPRFTGFVDKVSINRSTGQVTLALIDRRWQVSQVPSLPTVIASDPANTYLSPGLTSLWPLDSILRANGVNSGPPARTGCVWYMSGHGSLWPEVGTVDQNSQIYGKVNAPNPGASPPVWVPGLFAGQVPLTSNMGGVRTTSPINTDAGGVTMFEGWVLSDTTTGAGAYLAGVWVTDGSNGSISQTMIDIQQDGTGRVQVSVVPSRTGTSVTKGYSTAGAGWHQVSVRITYTAASTAVVQVWLDGVAQTAATVSGLGARTVNPNVISMYGNVAVDSWQISSGETAPTPVVFTSETNLGASLNNLTAIPVYSATDAWGLIQQIVEAEFAVCGFDEADLFYFRNRVDRPTDPQVTVTSLVQVKDLQPTLSESTRARSVTCTVHPLNIGNPQIVWSTSDTIVLQPFWQQTIFAQLPGPTMFVPTTAFTIMPAGGPTTFTTNVYRAGRAGVADRRIYQMQITASQIDALTVAITIKNPYPWVMKLISPGGGWYPAAEVGQPCLMLMGQPVGPPPPTAATTATNGLVTVTSSTGTGIPALALVDSVWRQDSATAQALTDYELSDLARPRPIFERISIVGDPRLQLGDRVRISDLGDTATAGGYRAPATIADDVIIIGINDSIDPGGGYTQEITARMVAAPRQWVLGQAGKSEIGSTTWI